MSTVKEHSFYSLVGHAARLYKDRTALRYKTQTFTYAALIGKVNQLTALLKDEGAQPETVIAVILDRSPDMIIALLATLRAGAAYLPIDPAYPKELIEYMLKDAGISILLTSQKYKDQYDHGGKERYMEECHERLPAYPEEEQVPAAGTTDGHNLAYILYTSGSTGRPKGVQIEYHSLANFLTSMQLLLNITPTDRLLAVTTISFDIAALELFLPLISGAELVLTDAATAKDARLLLDIVRMEKITMMQATPSTWKMMLAAGWDTPLPLKILCGGESMTNALAQNLTAKGLQVWNLYGPTETTIWSTIKEIRRDTNPVTIGSPIANTQVYILDQDRQPVAAGVAGELYIAGEGVARGYLNLPALTAERFMGNPRMYRTGDLGTRMPNGDIQLHGRIDDQLKIRGYRIEPGEIETVLLRYPNVKDAVVKGNGDELLAYIIVTDPPETLVRDIRHALRAQLPEHMIPQHIIILDAFPLTSNGKIAKNKLPAPAPAERSSYTAPETNLQKLVAGIWSACLRQNQIGLHDDYFELGGTSIIALQIMTRLEKTTGKRLPLSTLFQAPTVEKLAALLSSDRPKISWEPLVPIKAGKEMPALYLVQGYDMNVLGFNNIARYLPPDLPVYGFQLKGLNGIDEPQDTIEAMAADYLDAILEVDSNGPYYLAGYSYGGIIAFEMAQQLAAKGKKVAMLAIIDTYVNNWYGNNGWIAGIKRKTSRQFKKVSFILRNLQRYPVQTVQYQLHFIARKARSMADFFRPAPDRLQMTAEEKANEQYALAYHKYRIQPYDGDIDLFRVKTRLYFLDDLEYMGWKPSVKKQITVHEVPGDHKTVLLPPNDKYFSEILTQLIRSKRGS